MSKIEDRIEREARADRLKLALKNSEHRGPTSLSQSTGIAIDSVKAHLQGRNGFGQSDARSYCKSLDMSVEWLYFGVGDMNDGFSEHAPATDVRLISWVTAGEMTEQPTLADLNDYPTHAVSGLGEGNWVALRVDGDSMNKISPHGSVIYVDLDDKRLVARSLYVIADETGQTTYKRYMPGETPEYQPASYKDIEPPRLEGAIRVIGKVKRSTIATSGA